MNKSSFTKRKQKIAKEFRKGRTNVVAFFTKFLVNPETNLYDDFAVSLASGRSSAYTLKNFHSHISINSTEDAARFIINLLRTKHEIRQRFPKALSAGLTGEFALWLTSKEAAQFGLTADALPHIEAAFAAELGTRAKQAMLYRFRWRRNHPEIFLPAFRRTLIKRLFDLVDREMISRESVWWCLLEMSECPILSVTWSWQHTPAWQEKFPDGITRFGRKRFATWLQETYQLKDPDWLNTELWPDIFQPSDQIRLAYQAHKQWHRDFPNITSNPDTCSAFLNHLEKADAALDDNTKSWLGSQNRHEIIAQLLRPGVNIFGHFSYPSGLRASTELIVKSLTQTGMRCALRNMHANFPHEEITNSMLAEPELFDISIIHIQPDPHFIHVHQRSNLAKRDISPYQIGYWYWEFDAIPSNWDASADACDEIWTATEFIASGLRSRYKKPVHVFSPGLELPEFTHKPRSHYDLPEGTFIFLFVFSMTSTMERKNPIGLIRAFKKAFKQTDNAMLVIKSSFGRSYPRQMQQLAMETSGANVRIIDEIYSTEDTLNLMRVADAYVSLHRSEGLGLTMAESMLLGKPTIATNYSGNLEFMNEQNSLLVDYQLTTMKTAAPPYPAGLQWAQPSEDHAAKLMRKLYDDQNYAKDLGKRAQLSLQKQFNHFVAGQKMANRLQKIKERGLPHIS